MVREQIAISNRGNKGARKLKKYFYEVPENFAALSEKEKQKWTTYVYKDFVSQIDKNYEVIIRGAGLIGTAYGEKTFLKTVDYLKALNKRKCLKCRINWCKSCSLYKLNLNNSLIYHVIKLSKAQILRIVDDSVFNWEWSNPDGEFARSQKSAQTYWLKISKSKSKPVFYIRLMCEDYAEYLLGSGKRFSYF